MRDPGLLKHLDPLAGLGNRFDGVLRDAKKEPSKDTPAETPKAAPKATQADAASATKTPTAAQVKEINAHLAKARQLLEKVDKRYDKADEEKASKEAQLALDLVVKYYGIDASNVNGKVAFEWADLTRNAHTDHDRKVFITPLALGADAPSAAATVIHEVTHANQIKLHGPNEGTDRSVVAQNHMAREVMGYEAALASADKIGLSAERKKWYAEQVDTNKSFLSQENLKLYESGQYWGMKARPPGE